MEYYYLSSSINIENIKNKTNIKIIEYYDSGEYEASFNNILIIFGIVSSKKSTHVDSLSFDCNDNDKKLIYDELYKLNLYIIHDSLIKLYKDLIKYEITFKKDEFSLESILNPNSSFFNKFKSIIKNQKGLKDKKFKYSNRGFKFYSCKDKYNSEISLSESSSVEPQIWLGLIKPFNEDVEYNTRMLLNVDMAKDLVKLLNYFIKNGYLPNPNENDKFNDWLE